MAQDLRILTVESEGESLFDMGIIPSGTSKIKEFRVFNSGTIDYTNVTVKAFDYVDTTALEVSSSYILGGDGLSENVSQSYVFASPDRITWSEMSGNHKFLTLIPMGETLESQSDQTFYIKVQIPEGEVLNMQRFHLVVMGTPYTN